MTSLTHCYLLTPALLTNAITQGTQNSMHMYRKQAIESVISPSMWNAVFCFLCCFVYHSLRTESRNWPNTELHLPSPF